MRRILVLVAAVALCSSACQEETYSDDDICGAGELVPTGDSQHCVYPRTVIIEGFLCPSEVPERHDFDEEVVCSESESLSDEEVDGIRSKGYGLEPQADAVNPGDECAPEGAQAPSTDGCNGCFCDAGRWSCTERACNEDCVDGETIPAGDGCNTCVCEGGSFSCTEIGCPSCAELDPESCAVADDCATIDGRPLENREGSLCVDYNRAGVPQGCFDNGTACGAAETLAAAPGAPGECFLFTSTCIPMGWEVCGELAINECSETEVECSLLDADACGGVDGCQTISGRELVDDGQGGQCFSFESQEVEVGCMGEDIDCGDAITFAASPDDPENCHMFNNTCIPSGWTACEASFEVCP